MSLPIIEPPAAQAEAEPAEAPSPEPSAAAQPQPRLKNLIALVVDDDEDGRRLITSILTREGAQVYEAASVSQAVDLLRDLPVQLLVSDIAMPGEDGYTLVRKMRMLELPEKRNLPAIALTSFAREQDRTRAIEAGFNRHIAKPIAPPAFMEVVVSLVSSDTPPASVETPDDDQSGSSSR
ncbi:MAG: response regulator [Vicinamibacterales bacterium]